MITSLMMCNLDGHREKNIQVHWHDSTFHRRDDIGTELAIKGRVYICPANSWQWKYQGIFGSHGPSSQST